MWRRWRRAMIVSLAALLVPLGSVGAIAIAEPDGGAGHAVLDWAEDRVRQNETLHYGMHRALGYAFGLCPCTERLSRSQHARAAFHRPRGPAGP